MTSLISNNNSSSTESDGYAAAFTLVELLLVLVLMAVTVATIMPRIGAAAAVWQSTETGRNLLAAIRYARHFALTTQQVVVFMVDANNLNFTVKSIEDAGDCAGDEVILSRRLLADKVEIVAMPRLKRINDKPALVFWPDGTTDNVLMTVTASTVDQCSKWQILVKSNGAAELTKVLRR
jgi:Tfp pilus assembly protein FimT